MDEAEEAEDRALRRTSTRTIDGVGGEDDQVMTGLMSAATLGGGLVMPEGIEVLDEDDLEDSVMTATNTPTPADSIQPN